MFVLWFLLVPDDKARRCPQNMWKGMTGAPAMSCSRWRWIHARVRRTLSNMSKFSSASELGVPQSLCKCLFLFLIYVFSLEFNIKRVQEANRDI